MRNKLIELLDDAIRYHVNTCIKYPMCKGCPNNDRAKCSTANTADHLIANGVTLQQWIPVSERLPDELPEDHPAYTSHIRPSKDVLVKRRDDDHLAVAWYSYGFNDWTDAYEQESFNDVTHWQELPEPPKGE